MGQDKACWNLTEMGLNRVTVGIEDYRVGEVHYKNTKSFFFLFTCFETPTSIFQRADTFIFLNLSLLCN